MPKVSNVTFQYVIKALEMKTNISIEEMLKNQEIALDDLKNDKKIESYKLSAILKYCMEKTNNPNLALELGQSIPYQSLGLLGYLLSNAKNLGEMIEKFNTYQKLVSSHLKFNFSENEKYYKFAIYINENKYIPVPRFHAEVHLSAILTILTEILGQRVVPDKTHFSYSKQNDSEVYKQVFGKNIYHDEDKNVIFFDKSRLNIPVNNANPEMLNFFESQIVNIISAIEDESWFSKVKKEILKNIGDKDITINAIASNFDLSVRTLQNYLKNESKTFSEALSSVRKELSYHYIKNSKLDDISISIFLGYSEVSSFYRAFKSWTQKTPKEVRIMNISKRISSTVSIKSS